MEIPIMKEDIYTFSLADDWVLMAENGEDTENLAKRSCKVK